MKKKAVSIRRRSLLAAVPAAALPLRIQAAPEAGSSKRPSTSYPGAQLSDEQERLELNEALGVKDSTTDLKEIVAAIKRAYRAIGA